MRIILAAVAALALGACNLPTLNIQSQVNLNTLEGVVAGYGIVLQAELAYKRLPLCKTGTAPSINNICAKRSIVNNLIAADKVANADINTATNFISNNPSADPSTYISVASNAVLALQALLNAAKGS